MVDSSTTKDAMNQVKEMFFRMEESNGWFGLRRGLIRNAQLREGEETQGSLGTGNPCKRRKVSLSQ
jgi:hypothetical protein